MSRIAVGIEYFGGAYAGWQEQAEAASIQSEVQRALAVVADGPLKLVIAGRTDAGVHAAGQVAHFDSSAVRSARAWVLGANTHLPADIALTWASAAPEHFHARYSALARTYRYVILNRGMRSALAAGRVWQVHQPLDANGMQAAAAYLLGEHDFSAFRAAECQARSPIRRLSEVQVRRAGDFITIDITANAFLYHMVRNIVGLLATVGRGEAGPERAHEQLASRDRRAGAATAPAHGLYFWHAHYPPEFGLPGSSAIMPPLWAS